MGTYLCRSKHLMAVGKRFKKPVPVQETFAVRYYFDINDSAFCEICMRYVCKKPAVCLCSC